MIVCHCSVVSSRHVLEALQAGAQTLAAVCRQTGAGRQCGACVLGVKSCVLDARADLSGNGCVGRTTAEDEGTRFSAVAS
jgi:bacterioferritin-associated ferredoxin